MVEGMCNLQVVVMFKNKYMMIMEFVVQWMCDVQ